MTYPHRFHHIFHVFHTVHSIGIFLAESCTSPHGAINHDVHWAHGTIFSSRAFHHVSLTSFANVIFHITWSLLKNRTHWHREWKLWINCSPETVHLKCIFATKNTYRAAHPFTFPWPIQGSRNYRSKVTQIPIVTFLSLHKIYDSARIVVPPVNLKEKPHASLTQIQICNIQIYTQVYPTTGL